MSRRCGRAWAMSALVVCLDSGAGNYDQLWLTTSLRGMAGGVLKVEILTEGVHSGDASAWCPRAFASCARCSTASRTAKTGRLLPASFHCEIPAERLAQARATAGHPRRRDLQALPVGALRLRRPTAFALPTTTDPVEALLNRTWRPTLSRHRRGRLPGHEGRRQRAAALHRLQAEPAPAAAGRGRGRGAGAQDAAGRQRALPGAA